MKEFTKEIFATEKEEDFSVKIMTGTTDYKVVDELGRLHNEDGPALVIGNTKEWQIHGKRHRVGGPAIVVDDAAGYYESWFKDGVSHRDDGPACSSNRAGSQLDRNRYEFKYYFQNGKLHRENGPALIYKDKSGLTTLGWYKADNLIREIMTSTPEDFIS